MIAIKIVSEEKGNRPFKFVHEKRDGVTLEADAVGTFEITAGAGC